MKLLLVGLPKVGKSSAGKEVASALDLPFIDLDHEIERVVGLSPREFVQKHGIESFRREEQRLLFDLQNRERAVVALGGGIVELPDNQSFLKTCGVVVYLENNPEELWKRFEGITGYLDPADPKGSFFKLAAKRKPLYEAIAHHKIMVQGLSIKEVAQAIVNANHQLSS